MIKKGESKTFAERINKLIYFIVNPSAGSGRAKAAVPVIKKIMEENNLGYSVVYTAAPDDFGNVASQIDFNKAAAIVCVGGDGTIQEYVGLAAGRDINFGVIPAGSGNDLILSMPVPVPVQSPTPRRFRNYEEKIKFYTEKIIKSETVYTDAITINKNKYLFNIGGTGIDIQTLQDALPIKKFIGSTAYFISLIKNVVTYKSMEMKITVDGITETGKYLVIAVCNGKYYGGGMKIAPPAVMNDGFITLCIAKKMPRLKLMTVFPRIRSGRHTSLSEVSLVNCSSVKLEFEGTKIINLDGNLSEFESPLTFEIMKNAVKLII